MLKGEAWGRDEPGWALSKVQKSGTTSFERAGHGSPEEETQRGPGGGSGALGGCEVLD